MSLANNNKKSTLKRFLESFSVWILLYSFYFGPVVGPLLTFYLLLYTRFWLPVLAYLAWIYLDRHTPFRGGRKSWLARNLWLWHHFRDYFPQRLVKTSELDKSCNYLLCIFPHGVLATSAISHFTNDTSDASKLFPGFSFSGFTLNINFYIPFFRELALGYGMTSVSKSSMLYQLKRGPGRILCIYPGGGAEAAKSQPGTYRLALKNRKGFIKLAITTGTHLLPVMAFGETSGMDQWIPKEGSLGKKIQNYVKHLIGAAPCITRSFLPQRTPITAVVGKPLEVVKIVDPTNEDIDRVHAEFVASLTELFEKHKAEYLDQPDSVHLVIED